MAQGKREPNKHYHSDSDLSIYPIRMMQYLKGERLQITDEGQPEFTLIQMCIIIRAMYYNAPKAALKGKTEEIRENIEHANRMVFAEAGATKRELKLLDNMLQMGDINSEIFDRWVRAVRFVEAKVHREVVELTVRVYRTIYEKRANTASRPKGSVSTRFAELDEAIIQQAIVSSRLTDQALLSEVTQKANFSDEPDSDYETLFLKATKLGKKFDS